MLTRPATILDIPKIVSIAYDTWPHTYGNIISKAQIDFMLSVFYNENIIEQQLKNENHYFVMAANDANEVVGYTHLYLQDNGVYKLSKLYILPNYQRKNVGKLLLQHVENYVLAKQKNTIVLNVNRANEALQFYIKNGFEIKESVDIPLDVYYLNDYIMQKQL